MNCPNCDSIDLNPQEQRAISRFDSKFPLENQFRGKNIKHCHENTYQNKEWYRCNRCTHVWEIG